MDPHKQGKHLSRLGKKRGKHLKLVEASVQTVNDEATIIEVVVMEELSIPNESKTAYTLGLRKQIIKALSVFLAFLFIVFSTINSWFPYATHGHLPLFLETLEVMRFFMVFSTTLALGLCLPFVIHFIWTSEKPALLQDESRFLELFAPILLLQFFLVLSFGYLVANPFFNFTANAYLHFFIITIPFGLIFELLIVAIFSNNAQPINCRFYKLIMKRFKK
ncbi:twin-arginine translocase subunit TatC [Lysinibacillus sp. NPDC097287]|uniref:twin-arginine translocase subunit TatC n=1 Tax=Lysinibacillus sp. NPDC097287 TaxID=3364144 RepID=UPI00381C356A